MPALVIDGLTVSVTLQPRETLYDPTDRTRMFDGSMRVLVRTKKRAWEFSSTRLLDADRTALEAKLNTTSLPLACSGDILGGAVSCIPEYRDATPEWLGGVRRSVIVFTLHEA